MTAALEPQVLPRASMSTSTSFPVQGDGSNQPGLRIPDEIDLAHAPDEYTPDRIARTPSASDPGASLSGPVLVALARAGRRPVPLEPGAIDCLKCQLFGRRRLLCSRVDECAGDPPLPFLGPVLLAACLALSVAFVLAVR